MLDTLTIAGAQQQTGPSLFPGDISSEVVRWTDRANSTSAMAPEILRAEVMEGLLRDVLACIDETGVADGGALRALNGDIRIQAARTAVAPPILIS